MNEIAFDELAARYNAALNETGFRFVGKVSSLDNHRTEGGGRLGIGLECLDREQIGRASCRERV